MAALPLLATLIHQFLLAILSPASEIKFPISHINGRLGMPLTQRFLTYCGDSLN